MTICAKYTAWITARPRCLPHVRALVIVLSPLIAYGAETDVEREALRREAWVAGQMSAIERDPRLFIEYQKSVTADYFRRENRLLNERYTPRLGDAIQELGKRTWDFAKSEEVDLALSAGSTIGSGNSIGRTIGVIKTLRDYGIRVDNITEKWNKAEAKKFVSLVREDMEVVLRDLYDKSNALQKRSLGKGYRPDFLQETDAIGKRFAVTLPYATDREIFAAAPAGPMAIKVYEALARKSDAQLQKILLNRDDFNKFLAEELGGQKKIIESFAGEMQSMQEGLSELLEAKRKRQSADKIAKAKEVFERKYERAHEYTYAAAAALQFVDPHMAAFVQNGGSAALVMSKSLESLASDGFTAAATGNFLGSAFALYSLFSPAGQDPAMANMMAQFQALTDKLNDLSKQIKGLDKKVDQFIAAQNAGYSDVRDQLRTITTELRQLQTSIIENENARIQADINSQGLICADRLSSRLFSVENVNSLDVYHQCLWRMYAFGIIEGSRPAVVYSAFAGNLAEKSSLVHVRKKLVDGDDIETMISVLEFLERYAKKHLDVTIKTSSLRTFSPAFNAHAVDEARIFSPRLWSVAVRSLINYRLGFSEYAPPRQAPSSRYLQDLAEIGEWMSERLTLLSSQAVVDRSIKVYRARALEVARLSDAILRADFAERYPSAFHARRLGVNLKNYLDLPVAYFLGYLGDRDWRTNGFSSNSARDLISLAGLMDLLEDETTAYKTTGDAEVGGGKYYCYRADSKIFFKSVPRIEMGTVSVDACGNLTDGGMTGLLQTGNLKNQATKLAIFYGKYGYVSPHFNAQYPIPDEQLDGITIDFNGRTYSRGIANLSVVGESYQPNVVQELQPKLRAEATRVTLAAHNKYFSAAADAPTSHRSITRKNVFEPLNEAYAAMLVALSARHGSCATHNPEISKIRVNAVSELDLENYIDGKDAPLDQGFWRQLSLTVDEGAERLLKQRRNTDAEIKSLEAIVEGLETSNGIGASDSIDLYKRALHDFAKPTDPARYRYCASSGAPSLITGMRAITRWNDLMEFGARRPALTDALSSGDDNRQIYKCTKQGAATLLQNSLCPPGYLQTKL